MPRRHQVSVLPLLTLLISAGCGPSDSGTEVTETPCKNDFECPAKEYCDPVKKVCTETMPEDNRVSGTVQCLLDALSQPGPSENGKLYVSGALGGEKAEFTMSTACSDDPDYGLVNVALKGRTPTRKFIAIGINLPVELRKKTGTVKLDPYVNYYSPEKHAIVRVWDGETKVDLAYGVSGTVEVTRPATKKNDPLELKVDIKLKLPVKAKTCVGPCVSQADCGPGRSLGAGADVIPYPECYEEWAGGPRYCLQVCGKSQTTDCTSTGGTCVLSKCHKPRCTETLPQGCEKPASDEACDYCCNVESRGGMDRLYNLYIYPLCACDANAPCRAQCATACSTHDSAAVMECMSKCLLPLLQTSPACQTNALKKCMVDKACDAYFSCLNKRCPL